MHPMFKSIQPIVLVMLLAVASTVTASTNQSGEASKITAAMKLYSQAASMDRSAEKTELLAQSESILRGVIKQNPASLDAHRKLMGVYLQMRDYPRAIQTIQEAITLSPEDPKLFIALAILYEHSGALEYANAILNEALALDPDLQLARDYQASIKQKMEMQNIAMETETAPQGTDKPHAMEKRLAE